MDDVVKVNSIVSKIVPSITQHQNPTMATNKLYVVKETECPSGCYGKQKRADYESVMFQLHDEHEL